MFVGSGVVAVLVGLVAGLAGGGLVVAHVSDRDSDGFYATSATSFATTSAALTSPTITLGDLGDGWVGGSPDWLTVRLDATGGAGKPLFVGIARENDIATYLGGSSRDEVVDANFTSHRVQYRHIDGTVRPPPPGSQPIWAASVVGDGTVRLTWPVESGRWGLVVMNADGSPGVDVDLVVAARTESLLPLGLGFIGFALVSFAGGGFLLWSSLRRPSAPAGPVPEKAMASTGMSAA
jgi:hypothetical protein